MTIRAEFFLSRGNFQLQASFTAPAGGITILFGPSGSGKTTLLRAIAGLEKCDGKFSINNHVWQDNNICLPTHRRSIGYVFQEANLFDHLSVKKNLEYGWRRVAVKQRQIVYDEAIALLELQPLLSRNPAGLSGGERQRVAIARALLTSPQLLLMDEPVSSLDTDGKADVLSFLETIQQRLQIPLLYVTHSPDELTRLANHVLLMENGSIVAQGPVTETLAKTDSAFAGRSDAFSILACRITQAEAEHHLTQLEFAGGTLYIPQVKQSALGSGRPVKLRVQARDVSLCLQRPQHSSILNILPATVIAITQNHTPGQCVVSLDLAGSPLLAHISEYSRAQLQLKPGSEVYAQIKAMALAEQ